MVVFLTGATSGIGEALARHYAAQGAKLGLLARRGDLLDSLSRSLPSGADTYIADVRDLGALKAAAADFVAKHGAPDLVIANAGISHGTATEFADDIAVFREILDINVIGMVNTFHPFLAAMRKAKRGTLVGIASVAGYRGLPGAGAYSASKAAAINYLESLRVELRGSGVRVATVCPGYIATPMTEKNPYPMPFILPADEFARRFAHAIAAGKDYAVIPWQMDLVAKLLTVLPNTLFDAAFSRTGRKPRKK
jgi:short-subunit dehydrogenase